MSIKVINVSDESWLLYDGVIPALDAGIQVFLLDLRLAGYARIYYLIAYRKIISKDK